MKMKTVAELIDELKKYPSDAYAAAYSAEATGIVIYPTTFATYGLLDTRSTEADESVGFIDLYFSYDNDKRPKNDI